MANEKKVSKVEVIKEQGHYLRGTIKEQLVDGKSYFTDDNLQLMKFHGMYQQDDRDLRKQLMKEGKERHYMMMIRARIPGGVMSSDQYLQFDDLSNQYGNQTLRITTRQTFQLHGVLKKNLKETIKSINDVLITTLGGCGDQTRNIISCAAPHEGLFYESVRAGLLAVVDRLGAKTNAYHEIWLDGEKVDLSQSVDEEPLYGKVYMPRKFKVAVAYEGDNCMDVYSNDIGIVAHRQDDDNKEVAGYTLLVGGGMGRTAADSETYPRLASPLAFVMPEDLVEACVAILKVQRDNGNRENRKFARMKYLIDENGLEWFTSEVEKNFGKPLTPPRELKWDSVQDHLGWHQQDQDKGYLGIYVQNGRVQDTEQMQLKSALREIVQTYRPSIRLTTQQNIILAGLSNQAHEEITAKLKAAGVPLMEEISKTKLNSMACPAMPTCGLAIAESERALPEVLPQFERLLEQLGLQNEDITIRMTGCPNGCARPYISEIGFVGRTIGKYDVFLGADAVGTRMNTIFKEMVPFDQLVDSVRPALELYAKERNPQEAFGDYCHRVGFEHFNEPVRSI